MTTAEKFSFICRYLKKYSLQMVYAYDLFNCVDCFALIGEKIRPSSYHIIQGGCPPELKESKQADFVEWLPKIITYPLDYMSHETRDGYIHHTLFIPKFHTIEELKMKLDLGVETRHFTKSVKYEHEMV